MSSFGAAAAGRESRQALNATYASAYWGCFKTTECMKVVLGHRAGGLACRFKGWSLLGTEARHPYPHHGGVAGLHGQEEDTCSQAGPLVSDGQTDGYRISRSQ